MLCAVVTEDAGGVVPAEAPGQSRKKSVGKGREAPAALTSPRSAAAAAEVRTMQGTQHNLLHAWLFDQHMQNFLTCKQKCVK